METQQSHQNLNNQSYDGKTIALISYLTIIGWIVAFVMHGNNKTNLGIFHLRQSAFLMALAIAIYVIQFFLIFIPYVGWALSVLLGIGLFILWIFGLIAAISGEEKTLPIFGGKIQQLLRVIT